MNRNEILKVIERVHSLKKGKENALPQNSYFLDNGDVLCYPAKNGDSRFPYCKDGMVLFAHSNGYIDCVESLFSLFRIANYNEDTSAAFFAGEKQGDYYFPISITGAARQLFEQGVERYCVFTPVCVYYIVETEKAYYAARVYIDDNKHVCFSIGAVNIGDEREIYLASFFEPALRYTACDDFFKRMTKYGEHFENGSYVIHANNVSVQDYLSVRVRVDGDVNERYFTTAKNDFVGMLGGNVTNAQALKYGCLERQVKKTNTTDLNVISDMVRFNLKKDGFAVIEYEMQLGHDKQEAFSFANGEIDAMKDNGLETSVRAEEKAIFDRTDIKFGDWHNDKLHPDVINNFLKYVQRQVSFCALGKNYAGEYLGIRDVFQQLESALIWQPKESRAQIVRGMNYILSSGRAPRQISFAANKGVPKMDLRPFIDQGFWIVAALHNYLAFTEDFSILQEECGYFTAEKTYGPLSFCDERDSILCHLIRITEFLISNIDDETHCIHALYGDWNDALDGMGKTTDKSREFGTGVSMMATEQMYLTLGQMCDILKAVGNEDERIKRYSELRNTIARGVFENAVKKDENGVMRVIHGWGDKMSYFVGSPCDFDGKSRVSLTANAYCAISGLINTFSEYKDDIVKTIMSLDTKYGLLTFDKPFYAPAKEVGRIATITPGTYENSCAYVHAGTFGVLALFMMGEAEKAWSVLEKAMVISHENVTKTTFAMPNSYCFTEEYSADGDSMGDWYTGSGTVLIKDIIKCGFGIEPDMNGIKVAPGAYFPAKSAEMSLDIKNKRVTVKYLNENSKERKIFLNGEELKTETDAMKKLRFAYIPTSALNDVNEIVIKD